MSGNIEIAKLCAKYQICQAQYYKWRDLFLQFGHQAFEQKNISKKEQQLESENQKLKRIIGDLTVELKKANTIYETRQISIHHPAQPGLAGAR